MTRPPATRWALARGDKGGYAANFARLVAAGEDVDGEARLADVLLPRGGAVLDVGAGMGRVTAALRARGHRVVGIEPDVALVDQAEATYPGLGLLPLDVLAFDPAALPADAPRRYDLVVLVGNVLTFLAEGTERAVLARVASWLAPGGRVLAGFHLDPRPPAARHWPVEELARDAEAVGLRLVQHHGSYRLEPPDPAYAVVVLAAR